MARINLNKLKDKANFRTNDPDTSKAAGNLVGNFKEQHFLRIMEGLGVPRTAEQIADEIILDYVAVNRRLPELERQGLVVRTDVRRTNRSGRKAIVWRRKK